MILLRHAQRLPFHHLDICLLLCLCFPLVLPSTSPHPYTCTVSNVDKLLCDLHFPRECLHWHFRFLMRMPSVFFLVMTMDPRKSADLMIYVSHTMLPIDSDMKHQWTPLLGSQIYMENPNLLTFIKP